MKTWTSKCGLQIRHQNPSIINKPIEKQKVKVITTSLSEILNLSEDLNTSLRQVFEIFPFSAEL